MSARKGRPGIQPRMKGGEQEMRMVRTLTRHVLRKVKQGRPGRPAAAPRFSEYQPQFDWEKVVNASQKRRLRLTKTRKNFWGRVTHGGLS
jgi:hypothetical protein